MQRERHIWYLIPGLILLFPIFVYFPPYAKLNVGIVGLLLLVSLPIGYIFHQFYRIYFELFTDGYVHRERKAINRIQYYYYEKRGKEVSRMEALLAWVNIFYSKEIDKSFIVHNSADANFIVANGTSGWSLLISGSIMVTHALFKELSSITKKLIPYDSDVFLLIGLIMLASGFGLLIQVHLTRAKSTREELSMMFKYWYLLDREITNQLKINYNTEDERYWRNIFRVLYIMFITGVIIRYVLYLFDEKICIFC